MMAQLPVVAVCTLIALVLATTWRRYRARMVLLDRIPTVGHSGFFSSYISAYKFLKHGAAIVQEGCDKYGGAAFKIPLMDKWIVIISNVDMIEDFYRASESQLSLQEAFRVTFHADLVLGKQPGQDPYHVGVIQGTLTRNIGAKFPEIYDELLAAFNDELPPTDDWVEVPTAQKVMNIVCRTSNRVFVNLPLCRNKEWRSIVLNYTTKVFTASQKINVFPKFMQPLVGWWINPRPESYKRAVKYLEPIILDRLEKEKEQGVDWDAPEDLLTWLLKGATVNEKERRDPANLILSILTVNMGAIHTTSMAFSNAIFNLARNPELIDVLRQEIEPIVREDGWTKNAMGRMWKLDSFLKESQRYSNSFSISVQRMPLEDFTFSNGTVIPAGTIIVASPRAIHFDESHYPNPSEFDAFRSYRMREKDGPSLKNQMATPETNYLAFGIGKHACPGRVFAVTELKLLMSHLLLNYDIKFDDQDGKPTRNEFGGRLNLDEKTKVMFRKRVVV